MQNKFASFSLKGLILVCCAWLVGQDGGAVAQPAPTDTKMRETITVYAPYVVRRNVIRRSITRRSSTGLEVVSVDRAVSFADLDLTMKADQTTLENRVNQAARDACRELDRRFPKSVYTPVPANQNCVGDAVDNAMKTVNDLVMAANSK